jgi:hypothetical protein
MSEGVGRIVVMPPAVLLDFEATHPRHTGWKEQRIREQLELTPARYYQLLARAARSLDGQAHDPATARIVRARLGRRAHTLPTVRH